MVIESGSKRYQVGDQVADAGNYRLYLCTQQGMGYQSLLQIATDVVHNGALDRAAYILRELKRESNELEVEYEKVRKDPKVLLNYDLGFPQLEDSFICQEQGGRRINILTLRGIEDVSRMVPIRNITDKDQRRVDLRTSAWIMGKSLKLLVFAHSQGIAVRCVDGTNILIEPNEHYVVFFDWSDAQTHLGKVPTETQREEIANVAQAVIIVLGGDIEKSVIPNDGDKGHDQYTDFLFRLARDSESNAGRAHAQFYELIDELWDKGFYPFTTKPLD